MSDVQTEEKPFVANYDEAAVPAYTLPDALRMEDGRVVTSAAMWIAERRQETLRLFQDHVYGHSPERPADLHWRVTGDDPRALDGLATRREISLWFSPGESGPRVDLLLYVPNTLAGQARTQPVPVALGLNFRGNHTVHTDPGIRVNEPNARRERGESASRWPVEMVMARGYALATAHYGDIDPDVDDFSNGVHPLFYKAGQTRPGPREWGAIGAWAWGLSRILDYLETDTDVDAGRVLLHGHSRLGKTALWAGAQDERFSVVVSNNSGCGGAAISRRKFGETVASINRGFPYWFCTAFKQYNDREETQPVDQHQLIALMAPRPVYIASATEDLWADPRGEFLGASGAGAVYDLFGLQGVGTAEMPGPDSPVGHSIGYHLRTGKHDITAYDWTQYMDFADRHWDGGKASGG